MIIEHSTLLNKATNCFFLSLYFLLNYTCIISYEYMI